MYQDTAGKCIKRNADPSETHDDGSQNAPPKKAKVIQKSDKTHDPTNDFEQEPTCSYATKSDYMVEEGENNSDEDISYSHNFYDESLTLSPVLVPSARPDRMRIHSESLMCEEQIPAPSHPRTSTPDLMNLSAFGSDPILISDEEMESESFDAYMQRYVAGEWNQPMVDHRNLPLSTGDAAPPRTCTVTQPTVSDPTEAGSSSSPRDAFPQ